MAAGESYTCRPRESIGYFSPFSFMVVLTSPYAGIHWLHISTTNVLFMTTSEGLGKYTRGLLGYSVMAFDGKSAYLLFPRIDNGLQLRTTSIRVDGRLDYWAI
jgi:hypothetical protein